MYLEILIARGDLQKFDDAYAAARAADPPAIRPATYEGIFNFFLHTKKDAQRALSVWYEFFQSTPRLPAAVFNSAFSLYRQLGLAEEVYGLFALLKSGDRGIVAARFAFEHALDLAVESKDSSRIRAIAEEAVWGIYDGRLKDFPALVKAREFLRSSGAGPLRADQLLEAHQTSQADPNADAASHVITFDNHDVYDHVSPAIKNPEEVKKKLIRLN